MGGAAISLASFDLESRGCGSRLDAAAEGRRGAANPVEFLSFQRFGHVDLCGSRALSPLRGWPDLPARFSRLTPRALFLWRYAAEARVREYLSLKEFQHD